MNVFALKITEMNVHVVVILERRLLTGPYSTNNGYGVCFVLYQTTNPHLNGETPTPEESMQ